MMMKVVQIVVHSTGDNFRPGFWCKKLIRIGIRWESMNGAVDSSLHESTTNIQQLEVTTTPSLAPDKSESENIAP